MRGSVTVAGRTLDVRGVVTGDAIAFGGDVVVHAGGAVQGDAMSLGGRVVERGGIIRGDTRQFALPTSDRNRAVRETTRFR